MILRVKEAFSVDLAGVPHILTPGQLVDSDDPVAKGRAHLFEPVEDFVDRARTVEQASAAPGERRDVTLPKPSRARARRPKG